MPFKKKKNEKEVTSDNNTQEEEEKAGGKLVLALVTILIIAIWLGIIAILIKTDVGGFGSSVLYPVLKDVPYIRQRTAATSRQKIHSTGTDRWTKRLRGSRNWNWNWIRQKPVSRRIPR